MSNDSESGARNNYTESELYQRTLNEGPSSTKLRKMKASSRDTSQNTEIQNNNNLMMKQKKLEQIIINHQNLVHHLNNENSDNMGDYLNSDIGSGAGSVATNQRTNDGSRHNTGNQMNLYSKNRSRTNLKK